MTTSSRQRAPRRSGTQTLMVHLASLIAEGFRDDFRDDLRINTFFPRSDSTELSIDLILHDAVLVIEGFHDGELKEDVCKSCLLDLSSSSA